MSNDFKMNCESENSMTWSSTQFSPFELLTGVKISSKDNLQIQALLESEYMQFVIIDKST